MPFDDKYRAVIGEFAELARDLDGKLNDPTALRTGIKELQKLEQRALEDGDMPDLVQWTRDKIERARGLLKAVEKQQKPYRK